jgi:transposase
LFGKRVFYCLLTVSNLSPQVTPTDSSEVTALKQQLAVAKRELDWAHLKIQTLEERLRQQRIAKYGAASEKLTNQQLELLETEPGVCTAEVIAEAGRDTEVLVPRRNAARKQPHPGRQELPADLPRVEKTVPVPAGECACRACGKETEVIGHESSEQLDVEPARYFVRVTKREKRACRHCAEGGVKTAAAEAKIVEKSLVSNRVIVDTVVAKYCDHLPLYRQSAMLARDAGVEIHRATMDGWVMRVGELLVPLVREIGRKLVSGSYLQADETPVDVQVRDGSGSNHQAYLWQYSSPQGEVVFDFQMGRGREGPKQFLREFRGVLQTDGYSVYDKVGGPGVVHAACWAHARRKFVEALKLNPKDVEAARMIVRMDELFAVDAEARHGGFTREERLRVRREKAAPLVEALREELKRVGKEVLPASALGKAVSYTLSLWTRLVRFLEYAELELSNNMAENSMRGVALGRKNWIHIGSESAGGKVAAILSVIETCRRLDVPVRDYLMDVLPGMGDVSVKKLEERTPAEWKRHWLATQESSTGLL